MFRISKDAPVYYLISVANNRLPVLQTEKLKQPPLDNGPNGKAEPFRTEGGEAALAQSDYATLTVALPTLGI